MFMDDRSKLRQDIVFIDGLLELDGYHPYWKDVLAEAKQQMENELSRLERERAA